METKISLFAVTAIFILVILSAILVSAATITITSAPALSQTGNSVNIKLKSDVNETVTFSGLNDIIVGSKKVDFTLPTPNPVNLVADEEKTITIDYTVESGFVFEFGEDYSTILNLNGSSSGLYTQKLSFESTDYCTADNNGELEVTIEDITVRRGFSDNDNEWYPLDEVEVEVQVSNDGNEDIDNIELQWCLYDLDNKECVMDDEENDFDLKDGNDETITIAFTLDPNDLDSSVTNYEFHVRATGEVNGGTYDGDSTCNSDKEDVDVIIGNDFVVLSNIEVPETVQCNVEFVVNAETWNVGDSDQDDVSVTIENSQLGISEDVLVGDIDTFDKEDLNARLKITNNNVKDGSYSLTFKVFDEDDDIYESEDDEESEFSKSITVQGCGTTQDKSKALIEATLEEGGEAGKNLIIKATVTNTGNEEETFIISLSGYESWATTQSLEPSTLSLGSGESKDVLITLKVNKDVSGEKALDIEATPTTGESTSQTVAVTIQKSSGGFGGITGSAINGDNWYLWGIGALNIILVIVIIIVAVRVARS